MTHTYDDKSWSVTTFEWDHRQGSAGSFLAAFLPTMQDPLIRPQPRSSSPNIHLKPCPAYPIAVLTASPALQKVLQTGTRV